MHNPKIHTGNSKIADRGCFASRDIKKGEDIGDYTGEIIDEKEASRRYDDAPKFYLFDIGGGRYIDGATDDNPMKYINHSCDPNCESDQDGDRVFVYAIKNIKKGEEITYDYNLVVEPDDEDPYTCNCGSKNCRGTMKGTPEE
jgi:uncharacterized protein